MKLMKKRFGFTLLELLIVIAIIGILVAMGTASYSNAQKKSRDARRQGDMKAIQDTMEQYYSVNSGNYPASCPASGGTITIGSETFIIPTDPRNTGSYVYTSSGCSSSAYCYCALLETSGQGNSAANCNFAGSPKDYFCVKNLQ